MLAGYREAEIFHLDLVDGKSKEVVWVIEDILSAVAIEFCLMD